MQKTRPNCVFAQRSSGSASVIGGNNRKSASNPTSPVVQPRRAVSSPEELAVQDAIDAGFMVDGSDGGPLDADGGHYSTVSAIATAPRIHRQPQRSTPHVHSVFAAADGYGQHHACENLYSQVSRLFFLQRMDAHAMTVTTVVTDSVTPSLEDWRDQLSR